VEEFLQAKSLARRAKGTIAYLRWPLERFAGEFPVLPMDRRSIINHDLQQPGSPRTLRNYHEVLRNFYRWLGREHNIPIPQIDRPDLPKNTARPHFLTQEEIGAILRAARTPTERAAVIGLTQTAARRGEFVSLRRDNIHEHWALVTGKMGERVLYIPEEAYQAIMFAMAGHDQLYVQRAPLTDASLSKMVKALYRRAGLYKKGLGNHAFRHSYQGEFLENGGDESVMHLIMGHVRPGDKTMLYLHADPVVLRQAMTYAPRRFLQVALAIESTAAVIA